MNNAWKIEFWLEGGHHVVGKYVGSERDTTGVANKILAGDANSFNGLYGVNEQHILLVKRGGIVACDISVWRD